MGQAVVRNGDREHRSVTERDDLGAFEVLRELTNNGYVIDGDDDHSSGIRLRHDSAPDLVLHADGRVEVPLGQKRKSAVARFVPHGRGGISWSRTLAILLLLVLLSGLSAWAAVLILEGV